MNNKKAFWDVIWQIVKFILTLGLSHINKRENKDNNPTTDAQS